MNNEAASLMVSYGSRSVLVLAAALTATACETSTTPLPPTERPVASVDVVAPSSELRLGETLQLQATLFDAAQAPITGREVNWTVRGPATVDNAGVVTGTALGEATIIASSGGAADSAKIRIITPVLQSSPVVVGVTHACGISAKSVTLCWGNNTYGLLGIARTDNQPHLVPEEVATAARFVALSSQGGFTCGLTSQGLAYCWGIDLGGSLGTKAPLECDGEVGPAPCSYYPISIAAPTAFSSIHAFWTHGCGLLADGSAQCWGTNDRGQLGNGSTVGGSRPAPVAGPPFVKLAGSRDHTCGIDRDGVAFCWGDNTSGQLGLGAPDPNPHTTPQRVGTALRFNSITAHGQFQAGHTCGIAKDGLTYCWGNNDYGQLGIGGSGNVSSPVPVVSQPAFVAVEAGYNWTCGLTELGKAYCWGAADRGSIPGATGRCTGTFGTSSCSSVPIAVAPEMTFVALRLGFSSACGVAADDRAYCWGANDLGKLGNGSTRDATTPAALAGDNFFPPRI